MYKKVDTGLNFVKREQEVLDAAEAAKEKFSGLIRACLRKI